LERTQQPNGPNTPIRAFLSVQVDNRTGRLVLMSAVDNLMKGQAAQAIQCLNLMAGLPGETGLPLAPFYP
jgi:N-acetyl-gamma-glutamyl-phosphate reductase